MISPHVRSSRVDVVGIGAATLDDLWLVPSFSHEERVTQTLKFVQMGGGPVATALCVMTCLGQTAALLDVIGDDSTGESILKGLSENGVSLLGIRRAAEAQSAHAVIMVRQTDGARQITYMPATATDLLLDDEQVALIQNARLLHLNGRHEAAARHGVQIAQAAGVKISFDGGAGRYKDSIRDLVDQSQIKILSMDFASHFCGTDDLNVMMKSLLGPSVEVAVITHGMHGSHVGLPDGRRFHQPAYPAADLVDTTGCGDVFHGAFLHGWMQQWSAEKCADFASRIAAQNAEGLGGRWVCRNGCIDPTIQGREC